MWIFEGKDQILSDGCPKLNGIEVHDGSLSPWASTLVSVWAQGQA